MYAMGTIVERYIWYSADNLIFFFFFFYAASAPFWGNGHPISFLKPSLFVTAIWLIWSNLWYPSWSKLFNIFHSPPCEKA
jgi:hypothetical protein